MAFGSIGCTDFVILRQLFPSYDFPDRNSEQVISSPSIIIIIEATYKDSMFDQLHHPFGALSLILLLSIYSPRVVTAVPRGISQCGVTLLQ